ncbi:MAG: phenylalanine--tRNA ligase subunit beta [Christensenellales bacterium]
MKVPISWLKDFVEIDIDEHQLSDKLVNCGFEIEGIIYLKDRIQNVITAKITKIQPHPQADKLNICTVFDGEKDLTIISAAPNIKEGDIVPVALDNAVLADGKKINAAEFRGILSHGMMCSGAELDISEEEFQGAGIDGVLILPKDTPLGEDINKIIGKDDIILDIAITTNRQDCNSILGIAREVAVVTGKKLKMPDLSYKEIDQDINDILKVENENFKLCSRYMAKAAIDVKIEKSPAIIQKRLKAVGIRPINNLVDVTNYVLIEIGQPLHAFDYKLLKGGKIVVREALDGEKITALDGKEYTLTSKNLAICDEEKPVAIAGIMGGEYFSINQDTSSIVVESANFARDSVRHTSKQLNIRSESSQRFEKGIDFLSQEVGLNRALHLLDKYGWAKVMKGVIDSKQREIEKQTIQTTFDAINKVLGINVSKEIIVDILNSLEFVLQVKDHELTVEVPSYRIDIEGVNDLAEEVIRIYGYSNILPSMLENARMTQGGKNTEQKRMDKIKSILISHGVYEIVNYSFISPKSFEMLNLNKQNPLRDAIKISNPLGLDMSVMRTNLVYSMIKTLVSNITRGNKTLRLFEVAKAYIPKSLPLNELPQEKSILCLGFVGENEDLYSIKGVVEDILATMNISCEYIRADIEYLHPNRAADIVANGKTIGYLGEVHPKTLENFDIDKRIYIAEISVDYILENALDFKPFKAISRYQNMERDLAVIMDIDTPVKEALDLIQTNGGDILESCEVFDVYQGEQVPKGKKSVAFKLSFRHFERTLKEEEVNAVINNILTAFKTINAELR